MADTNDENPDGKGDKDQVGGAVITGLIAAGIALAAEGIKLLFNALQGRSIVGQISNNTPYVLTKTGDQHDHGGFVSLPPAQISPQSAVGFSSEGKGFLTGTEGSVVYTGDGFSVTLRWNNPELGDNSANATINGDNASRILLAYQAGSGNEGASMQYWLFVHPDYHVKKTLQHLAKDGAISVRSARPGRPRISLREVVSHPK